MKKKRILNSNRTKCSEARLLRQLFIVERLC